MSHSKPSNDRDYPENFNRAREKFRSLYKDKMEDIPPRFNEIFSKDTLWRLIKENPEKTVAGGEKVLHTFGKATQKTFVFLSDKFELLMYKELALKFGATLDLNTFDKLHGTYMYFRKSHLSGDTVVEYVNGEVELCSKNGVPYFYLSKVKRGFEGNREQAQNQGFVFRVENKIFLLGFRDANMRLSIGVLPESNDTDIKTVSIWGAVVSRSSSDSAPFGAKFIMVHEKNKELVEALSDEKTGARKFNELASNSNQYLKGTGP